MEDQDSGGERKQPVGAGKTDDEAGAARTRAFELAALRASGEVGYRQMTVQDILDRSGLSRPRFYRIFSSKQDCYARAYCRAIDELEADVLRAGSAVPDWLGGFRAALEQVARFARADPALAQGMIAEVHVAGGSALDKRKEVFERLSRAVDSARRETDESRHSPPPVTSAFILSAAEGALLTGFVCDDVDYYEAAIPSLVHIAASLYFGGSGKG